MRDGNPLQFVQNSRQLPVVSLPMRDGNTMDWLKAQLENLLLAYLRMKQKMINKTKAVSLPRDGNC